MPGQYPLPLKIDHPGFVLVTETLALADLEVCLAHIPYGPNSYIFAYIFTERYPRLRSMPPPQWVDAPLGNPGSATAWVVSWTSMAHSVNDITFSFNGKRYEWTKSFGPTDPGTSTTLKIARQVETRQK